MKRKSPTILHRVIFIVFLAGTYQSGAENVRVYGAVTDKETGSPIQNATVLFISEKSDTTRTTTNTNGNYEVLIDMLSTSVDESPRPETFLLRQNYPNPFNPATVIEYQIQSADKVQLTVYNVMGQKVRQLVDAYQNAGMHRISWNGKDDNEKSVAAGVYLYQLKMGEQSVIRKMLLLDGGGEGIIAASFPASSIKNNRVTKIAVTTSFTVAVKREGFVTFEDFGFTIPVDGRIDITLQQKKGATLYGTIQYQPCFSCRTTNWNGIIDPINIIVYDTNDYSKKLSDMTIEYPDTTFEITGLSEGIIDVVIQGDDIISIKSPEIQTALGDNKLGSIKLDILYNLETTIKPFITSHSFSMRLKKAFNDSLTAEKVLKEYGCILHQYSTFGERTYIFGSIPDNNSMNSAQIVQLLNNDQRIQFAEVGGYAISAKTIERR